jgi:hypothetical protein
MIRIGYGLIIMALATRVLGAVRDVALQRYFISVVIYQHDLRVGYLFRSPGNGKQKKRPKRPHNEKKTKFSHGKTPLAGNFFKPAFVQFDIFLQLICRIMPRLVPKEGI